MYKQATGSEERIKILLEWGFDAGYTDLDSGLQLLKQGLALAQEEEAADYAARANFLIGVTLFDMANYEASQQYILNSTLAFDSLGIDTMLVKAYRKLGGLYMNVKDYGNARRYLDTAVHIAKNNGQTGYFSSVYHTYGQYFINRAENVGQSLTDAPDQRYTKASWYERSLPYFDSALMYLNRSTVKYMEPIILLSLAEAKRELGNYGEAKVLLNKVLNEYTEMRFTLYLGQVYNDFSKLYLQLAKPDSALLYANRGWRLAQSLQKPDDLKDLAATLSAIYEFKGQYGKALDYMKQMQRYESQIMNIEKVENMASLEEQFQNRQLNENNETLTNQLRLRNMYFLLLLAILLGVIILLLKVQRTNKKVKMRGKQIEKINAQLLQLNQEQYDLNAVIAHDLMSPMNKVLGLLNIMKAEELIQPGAQRYVDMITQVTQNNKNLIRDIIYSNKLDRDQPKVEKTELALQSFFEQLAEQHRNYAQSKGIDLNLDLNLNDVSTFTTDEAMLSRVLDNLISNAIKFSPHHTTVVVSAVIGASRKHITLKVQDQGPGIPPKDQPLLFKKFKTLGHRTTGGESSSGLGLNIAKSLVERLKGTISVESDVNQGATFIVRLPLQF